MRSALAAFFDQYSAESSATKISAKRASTRGLPDSRTTASANSFREAIILSRTPRIFAHRSRIGIFAHSPWATRARETISGSKGTGVRSICACTSPVAGLIEGSESMGMAVAAISRILTDFEAGMWRRFTSTTTTAGQTTGRTARLFQRCQASSCCTSTMTRPRGGTVGPDFERSRSSNNRSISAGASFPRPTSSKVPTILRTM